MELTFLPMGAIDPAEYIRLHAHPLVRRHMPLMGDDFDLDACREWIKGKESMWEEYGIGPWAIMIDGRFAGWGGLQPEAGEADLGLVLHPDFWGAGKNILDAIIRWAFNEKGISSLTILLPPTRKHIKGILRLGFKPNGELLLDGEIFIRYRLHTSRFRNVDSD
jgi:[ribosomal protein S5]-alanine N-acetyltransferase